MEISVLALVGIGLGAMFFGYLFGLLEGRGQGYKNRKKEEALEGTANPPSTGAAPPTAEVARADGGVDPAFTVLRLDRQENGQPSLMLDGAAVDTGNLSAEHRKRLIELMLIMRPWVDGSTKTNTIGPRPAPASQAPPPRPVATPPPPAPGPSLVDRLLIATGMQPRPDAAVPALSPSPIMPEMSIVAQIDAILQVRLAATPLESLGVRLAESPKGDVIVVVGHDRFGSVGDVPDPAVQAAIRSAISEWERKYTPG
jgi:hypothetical protein